jgi:urease alpha subunit
MSGFGRRRYGAMFGPKVGDRLRLAVTGLVVEV